MDQNAFRNMLASGSGPGGSSSGRQRGVLGGPAPKRGWGIKPKPGHEYKAPDEGSSTAFAPRSQKKKDYSKDKEGKKEDKYMDRAERRRQGLDDEYKPVEQLLEDLEKRQKDEGVDQEEIDRQRAYLGGDATHSILVKGLDYALLARRKAELAAQGEDIADEELEALAKGVSKSKAKGEDREEKKVVEEPMAKGFKSIAAKNKETEAPKKKKKKKKVKAEPGVSLKQEQIVSAPPQPKEGQEKQDLPGPSVPIKRKEPTPPPVDDDDDIFGDAGAYDLTAGRPEDSDTDSEEENVKEEEGEVKVEKRPSQTRSRSRSVDKGERNDRGESRDRDYRRDRSDSRDRRDRSYSRERYDRGPRRSDSRDRYDRNRSYSHERYDRDDRRVNSYSRERYDHRDRSYSRERSHGYDRSYSRDRYDSRSARRRDDSPSRERYRPTTYSRSPSPRLPLSRSPSPPPKRQRQKTRSPSPLVFDYARPPSPTPSESSDDNHLVNGKLVPLKSSAISDLKGYLTADAAAAKEEEKRIRKAKWRARQGLGLQEGTEGYLEREVGDKEKMNRDYVKVMGKIKKDEEKDGKDSKGGDGKQGE